MLVIGEQRSRRRRHHRVWLVVAVLATAAVVYFSAELRTAASRAWREHRQQRALRQAKAFAANHDPANAALALQVALQADPENTDAWRTAADVLERTGDQRALDLRRQLLKANPDSIDDLLALAGAALRFNDISDAQSVLSQIPEDRSRDPAVLKLRAALSVAQGRPESARRALEMLVQLEPDNPKTRFNLAVLNVHHGDPATREQARAELARWANSSNEQLRLGAVRELATDASNRGDTAAATALTERLVGLPGATFADQLFRLDLVIAARSLRLEAIRAEVAKRAADAPNTAAAYLTWLLVRHRALDAWTWSQTLPETVRQAPAVAAATADCLGALGRWDEMARALQQGAWGAVRGDAIARAFSVRVANGAARSDLTSAWSQPLDLARNDLPTLRVLLRLAETWGWPKQTEETLFAITNRFPDQTWAFRTLASNAYARHDAAQLKTIYDAWHRAQPQDPRISGDWAMLTLLLEGSTVSAETKETVRRLYAAKPDDPFFATTNAFVCYRAGRVTDALAIMNRLPPEELEVPGRALYLGLFLAADGQAERARQSLARAEHANLLPPERALLNEARVRIAQLNTRAVDR